MTTLVEEKYTTDIAAPKPITSDTQNRAYIAVLKGLLVREDLTNEEKDYATLLTLLIKAYEDKRYAHIGNATPLGALKELIVASNLVPKDLVSIFGSRGAVSDALHGKRPFSKAQIAKLSARFNLSPAVFF